MTPKKVFTEAMIRQVVHNHTELEPEGEAEICSCGWEGTNWKDHFIDQLHKLWHELYPGKTLPRTHLVGV